jgi:hypothetical protein
MANRVNGFHLHAIAFFRAFTTCFGAFSAMLIVVFFTFFGAFDTYSCAKFAQLFRVFASKAHKLGRSIADCRAFHIQLRASFHVITWLCEVHAGAVVTDCCTIKAGINTGFVIVVIHFLQF